MDPSQIAELRDWARRLEARADDGELRAAARAILLLVGEVERLQAETESPPAAGGGALSDEEPEPEPDHARDEPSLEEEASLRSRLRRTFGYGGES